MLQLTNVFKIAWPILRCKGKSQCYARHHIPILINFQHRRHLRSINNVELIRPEKLMPYDPVRSGDLEPMPELDPNSLKLEFNEVDEMKVANEDVKKVFSLDFQVQDYKYILYREQLMSKVRTHPYEDNSFALKIAALTARIRFLQQLLEKDPYNKPKRKLANELVQKRYSFLLKLRRSDFKKFEWVLEQLNITFKPLPSDMHMLSEKESLANLIQIKNERLKEAKLAKAKKEADEKKIPFLEKKLEKLKWIMNQEESLNLDKTVTEEDIKQCVQEMEKVKLDLKQKEGKTYERKIHPFFVEPYVPDHLKSKIIE